MTRTTGTRTTGTRTTSLALALLALTAACRRRRRRAVGCGRAASRWPRWTRSRPTAAARCPAPA